MAAEAQLATTGLMPTVQRLAEGPPSGEIGRLQLMWRNGSLSGCHRSD